MNVLSHRITDRPAAPLRMAERKDDDDGGTGLGVATKTRTRTKKPSPYKVLMLNDDYTPMEFVVLVPPALLPHGHRGRDARHAPRPPEGRRRVRGVHLRGR